MASAAGMMNGYISSPTSSSSWSFGKRRKSNKKKGNRGGDRVSCVYTATTSSSDPYKTLSIHPGASESEVRKAFRQLALKYHPDVCRGSNCGVQFHQINEAYDMVMNNLRGGDETSVCEMEMYGPSDEGGIDEPMRGMDDPDWDMWEEWMGWEGAGIRDYSSHINPYI